MTQWILDVIAQGGYWGIFFLMTVENIFPPIPSELIMGMGGINVANGQMAFAPLLIAGSLGSTLGNYMWFLVGRKMGYERLRPFIDRWGRWLTLDWHDVEQMIAFFQRHGHWIVFVLRFSPLLRTMISLPAGLARMNTLRFLIYTLAGTTIWNILLISAGIFLGSRFQEEVDKYVGPLAIITIVVVVAVYVWRVATWRPRT
ncbi:MAG: DedA family protein [Sphingopyxis sp.]|jgi:membrane protein DedA with SNARE-associated domain|nr:DedA family protein [Sphingopyxis sp.]